MMPFAGFKTFNDCVLKTMERHKGEKGFTLENARKICGAIQARTEKKTNEELREKYAGGVLK